MCENKTAYLGLGSNLGDREGYLRESLRLLQADGRVVVKAASSLYETCPVGVEDQPDFLNAVIEVQTALGAQDLLVFCHSVEDKMGRKRTFRWGPRVIDVDILLYDNVEIADNNLSIPHKSMLERAFVMLPLAEIAPDVQVGGGLTAAAAASRVGSDGVNLYKDRSWAD